MNRRIIFYLFAIGFICAVLTIVILLCNSLLRKQYDLQALYNEVMINTAFQSYFREYNELPYDYNLILKRSKDDPFDNRLNKIFDPFGRNSNRLKYIPLFDKETNKVYSFMLLSAGYDGKFNFKHKRVYSSIVDSIKLLKESFYFDTTRLSNVNPECIDILYWKIFGNKDICVLYHDLLDGLYGWKSTEKPIEIDSLFFNVKKVFKERNMIFSKYYSLIVPTNYLTIGIYDSVNGHNLFTYNKDCFKITFHSLFSVDSGLLENNDTVFVFGLLDRKDSKTDSIVFNNVLVDENLNYLMKK